MMWTTFFPDARYAVRGMRRDVGFFAAAVLMIGLGVGAATTVYSVVNAILLRGLPFEEPDRLVWVSNTGTSRGLSAVRRRGRDGPCPTAVDT